MWQWTSLYGCIPIFIHQCEGQKFLHQIVKVEDVTKAQDANDADAAWTCFIGTVFGAAIVYLCLRISIL